MPNGVTVTVNGRAITVKGPKGELSRKLHPDMQVKVENGTVTVNRPSDEDQHQALHGLTRSLIANMVEGVTKGYKKQLEITGVGYKAEVKPFGLQLALGFSHPVEYRAPAGIKLTAPQPTAVVIEGSRQGEGRSGRGGDSPAAQAGAVQGQGRQVSGRAGPPEGGQGGRQVMAKVRRPKAGRSCALAVTCACASA